MQGNGKQNEIKVNFNVQNIAKLDPERNELPIRYNSDSFYIASNKRYIPFFGKDDNLPALLLEARLNSTTQNACITTIAQSIIGNGISIADTDQPDEDLINWMKSVNDSQDSFDKLLKKIAEGFHTNGNQFIEITRIEFNNKHFFKAHLHSMLNCRLAEPDDKGRVTAVLLSKQFAKRGYIHLGRLKNINSVPLWNPNAIDPNSVWKINDDGSQSTMLHFKNEVSGIDHYGIPPSYAALPNQVEEAKTVQHNLDNLDNNMILGGMLILKGSMTHEEAQANAKEIMMSHIGDGKTGRIAVVSSESGIADVDWKPYNTQREGSFIESDKATVAKIIAAHNWAKEFAFSDSGALGKGGDFLRSLWDLKEAQLLNPNRKELIDKVVIPIMQIWADWMKKPKVAKYKFVINSSMPFSFMGDIKPENFMTLDEQRKLAGLPPDPVNGSKYIFQLTTKTKADVQTESAAT